MSNAKDTTAGSGLCRVLIACALLPSLGLHRWMGLSLAPSPGQLRHLPPHVAFASLISFQTPSRQGRLCAPEGRAESFGDPVLLLRFMLQRDGFLAADGFQAWAGGRREGSVASQLLCIPLSDPPVRRAVQAGRCAQRHLNGCVWDPSGCLWWAKPWDCLPALSVTQHLLLVLFPD